MEKTLNTIIVLRNDKSTDWATSSVILKAGELGVSYIYAADGVTVKNVVVKAGDGEHTWAELKQIEGVFEKDVILTYNFGRHTTSNGFVNAGGTGMTTSEWLIDALSVTEEPDITKPEASISASFTPTSGETGTAITKINWNGTFTDGTYEYGSTETKDFPSSTDAEKAAKKKANASATWVVKFGDTQIGTTEDGSYAQSLVMGDTQTKVTLSAEATLVTANVRTPLNNVGAETSGKITTFKDGTTKQTFSPAATVTGYRKMFVGSTTAQTLDSGVIRGLSLKSAQASTTQFEVTAKEGATNLIIAGPTNSQGKNYTLSNVQMYSAGVWDDYTAKFEAQDAVQVADVRGGTNGLQSYNVYMYKFAALKGDTKFKITLKSANA
jgi:hypothetical protein